MTQKQYLTHFKEYLDQLNPLNYSFSYVETLLQNNYFLEIAWWCLKFLQDKWYDIEKLKADLYDLTYRKNSDYAGETDAFANFRKCEKFWVSMLDWIKVRMSDKISRIENLLQRENKVKEETIEDTVKDLLVYSIIANIVLKNHHQ